MTLDQDTIAYLKAELSKINDTFTLAHIDAAVAKASAPREIPAVEVEAPLLGEEPEHDAEVTDAEVADEDTDE